MLLDKYAPKTTKGLVGNSQAVYDIRKWLATWKRGHALLVHGPTGSGKSTAIKLIAQESGYDVIESHANENRNVKNFLQASMQQGVFSKKKALLFENIETMPMRSFPELIRASEHPIICTINDAYQLPLRKNFKLIKFDKICHEDLVKLVQNVCAKENIPHKISDLEQLARASNGDIRSLLIDLETFRLGFKQGYRNLEENIFNTIRIIFKSMSIENSKIAAENSEKDSEDIFRWLEQNITEEYTDTNSIATAYDYLSKADIFRSRIIRRQSWSLQKYFSALMVYGTSLAKSRPSARFVSYKPPVFLKSSSTMEKIAGHLHISRKRASVYAPVLRMLAKKNSSIFEQFGIEEDDIS